MTEEKMAIIMCFTLKAKLIEFILQKARSDELK